MAKILTKLIPSFQQELAIFAIKSNKKNMKRAIIIGATSGIGQEVARIWASRGWKLGIAGRREEALLRFQAGYPAGQVEVQPLDVTHDDAPQRLDELIARLGGMDLFFLSSGIGSQNLELQPTVELATAATNTVGFIRLTTAAFHYFKAHGGGHIAVISSIAGTKGLGSAPAYSATKRFQNTYIEALDQLARIQKLPIRFTDIRPGFVATDLLKGGRYPMLMQAPRVATHIVKAIDRRQPVAVIDGRYRLLVFFWRIIPRWLWVRLPVRNR